VIFSTQREGGEIIMILISKQDSMEFFLAVNSLHIVEF
jgi:hypothetical protein